MRGLGPLLVAGAAELLVTEPQDFIVVDVSVVVVVLFAAAIPDLVSIPDGAEVEVAKVRAVAEERIGFRFLTGDRIASTAGRVRAIDVSSPRILRDREAYRVEVQVVLQVSGEH